MMSNADAAKNDAFAWLKGMHVEALANPNVWAPK
jgi:hypothetical protein